MFEANGSVGSTRRTVGGWRARWQAVRDLVGGVLVIVIWVALFTSVWAAVDGPLSPARGDRAAAARVADAG